MQIEDNFGHEPDSHEIGGIYGFLTPIKNAAKKPGEWQTLEITLVGRAVTVVLNGEQVIDRQAIPGITGGALDSDEGEPGPIMLQGDHGTGRVPKVDADALVACEHRRCCLLRVLNQDQARPTSRPAIDEGEEWEFSQTPLRSVISSSLYREKT